MSMEKRTEMTAQLKALQAEVDEAEQYIAHWTRTKAEIVAKMDEIILAIPQPTPQEKMQELKKALKAAQKAKKSNPSMAPVDRVRKNRRRAPRELML